MSGSKKTPVIRIVDDDPGIHDSLGLILDLAGYPNIRHYYSAEEFLAADLLSDYGCAVVDLRMGAMSGLELQQKLKSRSARIPLIFLSGHGDIDTAVLAMQEGAKTFLTKPVSVPKLMAALEACLGENEDQKRSLAAAAVKTLTAREREAAALLKQGLTSRVVAERLGISLRTAEVHRTSVMRKLACSSLEELAEVLDQAEL